jgi:hypothetical protein
MIALHWGGGDGSPGTICLPQNTSRYTESYITDLAYRRQTYQDEYSKTPPSEFRTAMLDSKVLFMFIVTVIL